MFILIKNLIQKNGVADYKGLDINNIIPGYQIYSPKDNKALVKYSVKIDRFNEDVVELTEEEYNTLKEQIISEYSSTPEEQQQEKIQALEQSIAELSATIAILQTPKE